MPSVGRSGNGETESKEVWDYQGLGVMGWEGQVGTEEFREVDPQCWGRITLHICETHRASSTG